MIDSTAISCSLDVTVTEQLDVNPLDAVAVILAVPALTAVTLPLASTVATYSLLDFQVTDLSVAFSGSMAAVKDADFVTIHVPAMDSTKGMINAEVIEEMKKNVAILNFSRYTLVKEDALGAALEAGNVRKYVTDFANPKVVNFKNTIILPHLGASTEEAEDNCALMAIAELKDFLENGNIKNSVNYPAVNAGVKNGASRVTIAHKNVPGVINHFTKVVADTGANINTLLSQSRGDYAYTVLDTDQAVDAAIFNGVEGVIRVRVI